jgi:hypothetical protein
MNSKIILCLGVLINQESLNIMKRIFFLMLAGLLMPVHASEPVPQINPAFTKEVQGALTEITTIKPGQTEKELLTIFIQDGGLFQPENRRYLYRKCPCIKVEVRFGSNDRILTITKPYLELPFID